MKLKIEFIYSEKGPRQHEIIALNFLSFVTTQRCQHQNFSTTARIGLRRHSQEQALYQFLFKYYDGMITSGNHIEQSESMTILFCWDNHAYSKKWWMITFDIYFNKKFCSCSSDLFYKRCYYLVVKSRSKMTNGDRLYSVNGFSDDWLFLIKQIFPDNSTYHVSHQSQWIFLYFEL